jgi:sporulation-control protein spo0M
LRWDLILASFGASPRFLKKLGLSVVTLQVQLDSDTHRRDSEVTGTVSATVLINDRRLDRLVVTVCEYTEKEDNRLQDVATEVVASAVELRVDQLTQFRFSIRLPETLRLTRRRDSSSDRAGARLAARAITNYDKVEAEALTRLNVVPHREICAVFSAMERLGFTATEWVGRDARVPAAGPMSARCFFAPPNLADRILEISLVLEPTRKHLRGTMIVRWRDRDLSEWMQAMVGQNRTQVPLLWTRSELLLKSTKPNTRFIASQLTKKIDSALTARENSYITLLRAAEAPNDATLLRPARSTGSASESMLVRPAEDVDLPSQGENRDDSAYSSE